MQKCKVYRGPCNNIIIHVGATKHVIHSCVTELKSNSKAVSKGDVPEFLQLSSDSLLGHSIIEVNIKHHELIQPDLNDQFKQLCSAQTPVTKMLLGNDLPKSVTEIAETKKAGVKVSSKQ